MIEPKEIFNFLSKELMISEKKLNINSDLSKDFGVDGDDFSELIDVFSEKFNVDVSNFLWYFHFKEEGLNIGSIFVKSPDERVNRIAITPTILLESANTGKWSVKYPNHTLPKRRYDIIINLLLLCIFILLNLLYWYQNT